MAGTTISHSTPGKQTESNLRKKRSSNHLSNIKQLKSNTGRWKNRSIRPQLQLNAEERKQVHDLLIKFSGPKNFALPLDLPPWSPPSKLEDINPNLNIFRDYGSSLDDWDCSELKEEHTRHPTESNNQNEWKQPSGPVYNSNRSSANSHAITTTGINTAIVSSSSASPETFSSPSDQIPKPSHGRSDHPEPRYESARHAKIPSEPQPDRSAASIKGKEKAGPEIDWTGWEAQHYNNNELERMRARYADRAREFKRLSDVQRQQISQARAALPDPRAPIPEEAEVMSDLAAVGCVDSLLLFTQSFLATELARPTMTRADQCSQWSSMIGFLEVAKSTTRRSGIQLTHAICLMYESLLLDRLVEADRPILLQTYSHETDTEKLLEGFKKLKRIMNYQEISKASWLSAEKIFDRILSSSSPPAPVSATNPAESDRSYRTIGLPKLKALLQHMRSRERNNAPRLLSVDRPYRFCWPLDKTNLDSMADFVAFSRCALDEFLEANHTRIRFKLARFDDQYIIFPNQTPKPPS